MADLHYGRLTLDVPDDWTDASSLLFIMPPSPGFAAPLSAKPAGTFTANVSVSTEPLEPDDPTEPQAYLEAATALLKQSGAQFDDAGASAIKMGDRDGWAMERVLEHGGHLVRQLSAVTIVDGSAVIATASCEASRATADMPKLRSFIEKIRPRA